MNRYFLLQGTIAICAFAFLLVIVAASFQSSLFVDFPRLWAEIWIKVTLLDFYIGIAIFAAWVFYRERYWGVALAWLLFGFIPLGNLATLVYLAWALRVVRSCDDVPRFLLGKHAPAT